MPRFDLKAVCGPRAILILLLAIFFCLGGSARASEPGVPVLRAASLVAIGMAALTLRFADIKRHRGLALILAAMVLLVALHLLPLPYSWWTTLPGRSVIAAVDQAAGLGPLWRPFSMAPAASWNALMSLSVPAAVFLIGVQLDLNGHMRVLRAVILFVGISLAVGLAQASDLPITFYDDPTPLAGVFANRNHQALIIAMIFPITAAYIRLANGRRARVEKMALMGLCLIAMPLLLVTGSRSGLFLALAGLGFVPWLLQSGSARSRRIANATFILGALVLASLVVVTIWASRDLALDRLAASPEDLRWPVWASLIQGMPNFLPWGTGAGSYVEAYQVIEPDDLLRPTFSNHAHNEFLEILFTCGIPGFIILCVFTTLMLVFALRLAQNDGHVMGRLGLVLIAMIGMASLSDYPARTPIFLSLLSLFSLWVSSVCGSFIHVRRKEVFS